MLFRVVQVNIVFLGQNQSGWTRMAIAGVHVGSTAVSGERRGAAVMLAGRRPADGEREASGQKTVCLAPQNLLTF